MADVARVGLRFLYCFTFSSIIVIAACCAPVQVENMAPQIEQTATPKAATKTVRVVGTTDPGTGSLMAMVGVIGNVGEPAPQSRITDSAFRIALQNALTQSGLFKSVFAQSKADYELDGSVFSQQITNGWHYSATIGVRYKLVETATGKEVWTDSSVSQCDGGIGIMGVGAQSEANECAMRKNLSQLVDNLSKLSL